MVLKLADVFRRVRRRWRRGLLYCHQRLHPGGLIERRLQDGLRLQFRCDDYIGVLVYLEGMFEGEVAAFIRKHVKAGDVVADLGANIGLFTLVMSHAVGETGAVYAFEPSPRERECLEENILRNGLRNVRVEGLAVGAADERQTLHVAIASCSGLNALGGIFHQQCASGERVEVEVVRFDAYWERQGRPRLDFIKVDVEGSELDFLKGAAATLARYRPQLIMELSDLNLGKHGQCSGELRNELDRLGYDVHEVDEDGVVSAEPLRDFRECMNVVARPRELRAA
jgi:FkbM family methyltransferase